LKEVQPTTPLDLSGQDPATLLKPFLRALKISGIQVLELRGRLPRTIGELLQRKGQISTRAAVSDGDVLLGAQLNQSLDAEA
jgi:hypothetical protein